MIQKNIQVKPGSVMKSRKSKSDLVTLDEFIIENQRQFPQATGELSQLLRDITLACRIIARQANDSVLNDIKNRKNLTGYNRLDALREFAVDQFRYALDRSGIVRLMVTAFSNNYIRLSAADGKYIVVLHPIEGIPNMGYNASAASVFAIYQHDLYAEDLSDHFLRPGDDQVASGYILYGSSAMLVFTTVGLGVSFFTLDDDVGEFFLAQRDIRIPESAPYFSCNTGLELHMDENDQNILDYLRAKSGSKFRYIGSLSADIHRMILDGGVFLYPANKKIPDGKLSLLYECAPIAQIVENAGGIATDGKQRIMSKVPRSIHSKTPFYAGSNEIMKSIELVRSGEKIVEN